MPYYEYVCKECSVKTAAVHSMTDKFNKPCANCGKVNWEQQLFPTALKFVGSGFHVNDYKKGKL